MNTFAQNQNLLGVMYGLKNFTVREGIKDPLKRAFTNKNKFFKKKNICGESELITIDYNDKAVKLGEHITNKCVPWSYEESCSCDFKCPKDVRIIQSPFYKGLDVEAENDFVFRNDPADFEDSNHKMTSGYCWGHAIGTQRFNRMALFAKNHDLKINGKVIKPGSKRYEKEIKKRIRKVLRNKVA